MHLISLSSLEIENVMLPVWFRCIIAEYFVVGTSYKHKTSFG